MPLGTARADAGLCRSSLAKGTYLGDRDRGSTRPPLHGHLCLAVLGPWRGDSPCSNLYSLPVFPRRFGHQRLSCRLPTHLRCGREPSTEHRRLVTKPLASRHLLVRLRGRSLPPLLTAGKFRSVRPAAAATRPCGAVDCLAYAAVEGVCQRLLGSSSSRRVRMALRGRSSGGPFDQTRTVFPWYVNTWAWSSGPA